MNINAVKEYLRIDDDADDATIGVMIDAAKEYIRDAVGRCDERNPKTKLLFYTLMQDFYENRVLTVKESDKPRLAHATNSIVLQLQAQLLQEENNG